MLGFEESDVSEEEQLKYTLSKRPGQSAGVAILVCRRTFEKESKFHCYNICLITNVQHSDTHISSFANVTAIIIISGWIWIVVRMVGLRSHGGRKIVAFGFGGADMVWHGRDWIDMRSEDLRV
jgi:hypothetical protein